MQVDTHVSRSMARYAQEYIDFCRNVARDADRVWVEERVALSRFIPDGYGTVDFAVQKGDTLHVIDLKYGKGVQVDADTPQAKYYAVALIDTFLLKPKKIIVTIHQPRLGHISTATFKFGEIMNFAQNLRKAAKQVDVMDDIILRGKKGKPKIVAGSHCGFCKAKRQCRKLRDYIIQQGPLDTEGFTMVKDTGVQARRNEFVQGSVHLMNDKEIAEYFIWCDLATRTAYAVKDMATSKAASGTEFEGLKLVAGRRSRDWKNHDKAKEMLIEDYNLTDEQCYKRSLVTVAQAEALTGAKFGTHPLVNTAPGKPSLVTESDSRKAIAPIRDTDPTGFNQS